MARLQLTIAWLPRGSKSGLFSTLLLSVISLWALNSHAGTIYKSIDQNGNVVFTDQPLEGAQELEKEATSSNHADERSEELEDDGQNSQQDDDGVDYGTDKVAIAPNPSDPPPAPVEEEIVYPPVTRLEIISPPDNAVLIDPLGKIWIEMQSAPTSISASGLTAQLWVDNELVNSGKRAILALPIPKRGPHELQIKLVDHKDRLHAISDIINFHVKFQLVESNR